MPLLFCWPVGGCSSAPLRGRLLAALWECLLVGSQYRLLKSEMKMNVSQGIAAAAG